MIDKKLERFLISLSVTNDGKIKGSAAGREVIGDWDWIESHHMGKTCDAQSAAIKNIDAWYSELSNNGLDAIVINTSGCGTTVKDYHHMFQGTEHEEKAKVIAGLTKDISEILVELELPDRAENDINVAYHSACSLQHGQQISNSPKDMLKKCGYKISEPKNSHLCCGSAGTYNLLQPKISQTI